MATKEKEISSDIIEYVKKSGNKSFSDAEFNNADGLVLALLAYIEWERIDDGSNPLKNGEMTLREAIQRLPESYIKGPDVKDEERALMEAIINSSRFGDMKVSNYDFSSIKKDPKDSTDYDYEQLESIAAITFTYKNNDGELVNYIAYRGTDGTFEGWAEDFNMAYDEMTNAQRWAVEYLNRVAEKRNGRFQMGGHSKGGNDALYAFLFCNKLVRDRIDSLFSYDGPGFNFDLEYIDRDGNHYPLDSEVYKDMLKKLKGHAVCPHDSIIGQLLNQNDFIFIKTTTLILLDHDGYTWRLDPETGEFIQTKQSDLSKILNKSLDELVKTLSEEKRQRFMKALWDWLYSFDTLDGDKIGGIGENISLGSLAEFISDPEVTEVLCLFGILAIKSMLEIKVPGYSTLLEKMEETLAEKGLNSAEDIWLYFKEDPIGNTLDLLQTYLSDWDTLKALCEATVSILIDTIIAKIIWHIVFVILKSALHLIIANLPIVAAVIAVLVVCKLAVDFIREHWDEIVSFVSGAIEFVERKISEFVEAMILAIKAGAQVALTSLFYTVTKVAETFVGATDVLIDVIGELGRLAAKSLEAVFCMMHLLAYGLVRTVAGIFQSAVTIDMVRLQNAVDQMDRLASRVVAMDSRLDSLYGKLCVANIEQGEGIFTSIANMYHLSRADISVDDGYRIRRKATAISQLFNGYKDAEKWLFTQIGG